MSFAELIQRLQALPAAQAAAAPAAKLEQSRLAMWLDEPIVVPGFKPLSREEANERP